MSNKDKLLKILLIMVISGIFGFIYETIFYRIDFGYFVKRGETLGPWLPIYSFGGLLIVLINANDKKNKYKIFFKSMLVCGILEYICGYIFLEYFNLRLWDYNTEILNFGNINGFICLRSVLFFGISGLLLMYIVIPLIERLSTKISTKKFNTISISLFSMFFIDTIYNHIISRVINYLK